MTRDLTSEDLATYGKKKYVQAALRRARLSEEGTYSEFAKQLYEDIDNLIFDMQAGREIRQKDTEDRLTDDILRGLRRVGYTAIHDGKTGGHVDFSVFLGDHSWIGEAKKDGDFREGLLQLTTRYVPASGNYSHNEGGLVVYLIETCDARGALDRWKAALEADGHTCTDCGDNTLAIFSDHKLAGSGTTFKVRTMAVALFHSPTDRSGRETAERQASASQQR
jgi:hypothetical protein